MAAYKHQIEGIIQLRFSVDSLCNIGQVTVIKGLGYGLDEIAKDMVRNIKIESYYNGKLLPDCSGIKGFRKVGIDFKIDR